MRKLAFVVVATLCLAVPAGVTAHPDDKGETVVPWVDQVSANTLMDGFEAKSPTFRTNAAPTPSGSNRMDLVGNSDKDGTVNSDLAFKGKLAYAGNYDGFRILDISKNQPQVIADVKCRGPQNDVSVYEIGRKTYLFQSIDQPQTREDCQSEDTPFWPSDPTKRTPGFEGIRMFDVTNPAKPKYVKSVNTECGSHTHTLVPDRGNGKLYVYVSSYPLASGITPADYTGKQPRCEIPHRKISIITVPFGNPENTSVKKQPLSQDTTPFAENGMQACHDIQAFTPKKFAIGSCAGDTQVWSIADPANPTTQDGRPHTHIRSPGQGDQFEFMHSAFVSWDGKKMATMDETGGGGTAECDGKASQDGFYYFYKVPRPGDPSPKLESRFTIPRAQTPEICVSHNGNVIPIKNRDVAVASYYQGGNTVIDFTDIRKPKEIAWSDLESSVGLADSWSTYWYNGSVYVNGGLNRRGDTGNRGVDVFKLRIPSLKLKRAQPWAYSNPQTQEAFQVPE